MASCIVWLRCLVWHCLLASCDALYGFAFRYEGKLTAERDMGLRLKGENGIMKKRFSALQKDIDEAREECKALFDQKKDLYQVCTELLSLSSVVGWLIDWFIWEERRCSSNLSCISTDLLSRVSSRSASR